MTRGDDGKISYTKVDDNSVLSLDAQQLVNAISGEKVSCEIIANTGDLNTNNGLLPGGSFMGTTLSGDGNSVTAKQEVNSNFLRNLEDASGSSRGSGMLHEVTESYNAGMYSLNHQTSAPAATRDADKTVYNASHKAATNQPGSPTPVKSYVTYDANNTPTRVDYKYNNTLLMTYPSK
ncbi:hypothetical protein OAO55_01170 [Bacteroidales bacterium]|nr:hypothetical protein [Bacteroidales bacterium]